MHESSPFRSLWRSRLFALALLYVGGAQPLWARQLGSRSVDDWATVLVREERLSGLEIPSVIGAMELRPGDVVADIGAGVGVFSLPIARAVGPTGVVLVVEVDAEFMPILEQKAQEEGLSNVDAVLGAFDDPRLPRRDVDVAFFHDVLHHIDQRPAYLRTLADYMAPGSRMVVVDFDMNVPGVTHSNQPEMLISPEQVAAWMESAGFAVTREIDMFEDKFFVIYTRVN